MLCVTSLTRFARLHALNAGDEVVRVSAHSLVKEALTLPKRDVIVPARNQVIAIAIRSRQMAAFFLKSNFWKCVKSFCCLIIFPVLYGSFFLVYYTIRRPHRNKQFSKNPQRSCINQPAWKLLTYRLVMKAFTASIKSAPTQVVDGTAGGCLERGAGMAPVVIRAAAVRLHHKIAGDWCLVLVEQRFTVRAGVLPFYKN